LHIYKYLPFAEQIFANGQYLICRHLPYLKTTLDRIKNDLW
jgi:hypothetical protein